MMSDFLNHINKNLGRNPLIPGFSAFFSACVVFLVYINYSQFPLFNKQNIFFVILIALFVTLIFLLIYKLWWAALIQKIGKMFLGIIVVATATAAVSTTTNSINIRPFFPLYSKQNLTIDFIIENEVEKAGELSLSQIRNGFRDISFSELETNRTFGNMGFGWALENMSYHQLLKNKGVLRKWL